MHEKQLLILIMLVLSYPSMSQILDNEADLLVSKTNGPILMSDTTSYKLIANSRVNVAGLFDLNDQNIIWSSQLGGFDAIIESIPSRASLKEIHSSSIEG